MQGGERGPRRARARWSSVEISGAGYATPAPARSPLERDAEVASNPAPERFHINRRNRSNILALSHFRTENRCPLFLKMLLPEVVMTKYLLVSFKTCPWVQRAAIVLREKKIDFEFRHIDPENRPDWFLAISPPKKVPVLRLDDKVSLFESNAIAEYLDETIAPRLHPADPIERAINRAWTDYVPTFASAVTATGYAEDEA